MNKQRSGSIRRKQCARVFHSFRFDQSIKSISEWIDCPSLRFFPNFDLANDVITKSTLINGGEREEREREKQSKQRPSGTTKQRRTARSHSSRRLSSSATNSICPFSLLRLSKMSSPNNLPFSPRPPCLFAICEVRPHLYIAGYASVEEVKLRSLGITHCVDATNIPKTKRVPFCEYLCVPIDDSVAANATRHFQDTADFVAQAQQKGGKALIYCAAGVSRAATLTIMTLVINESFTLRDAYYRVLESRPIIAPNLGFWRQMIAWETERNGGRATVALLKGMRSPVPDVYLHKSEHTPNSNSHSSPKTLCIQPKMETEENVLSK